RFEDRRLEDRQCRASAKEAAPRKGMKTMEPQTLQAEVREKSGKGPARQLRMRGLIPAIYYGPGTEPQKLAVSPLELEKTLMGAYGRNQLIELSIGGEKKLALVRDLAINPVSRELRHADFYAVARDRKVEA